MRIPSYFFTRKGYQRFFAGVLLGFLIGWVFFLIQFGNLQEYYIREIKMYQDRIQDLNGKIKHWIGEYEKSNKEQEKKLKLQEIQVQITNKNDLHLPGITMYEISQEVQDELENLLGQNIESLAAMKDLVIRTLQNKEFIVDDNKYRVVVQHLFLYTTMEVHVKVIPLIK
ncbi:sporulation membrane protein YtrI [Fictibacillus gelatini]|uniref:sporulation membrane protein YtrI n=1 Tax=Fictibacillus gelatini TaxID=225985 RepID=UPI0003F81954|nr:sporulation membrane protein YtrI [Fictibacillus gelatini]